MRITSCAPLLTLCLVAADPAAASPAQWPAWRGPTHDGIAPSECAPPLEWSETKNVRWKRELPGLGASTPILVGERIYLTTAVDLERGEGMLGLANPDPPNAKSRHAFEVLAVERSSGEIAWRTKVREDVPHEAGHRTGSHASASIVTDGEHLWAFFGSRGLHCLTLDGEVVWSKDLGRMKTLEEFGEGASPAMHGDTLVVPWDHEGQSFALALDKATGEERWRVARAGDSSWGTPVIVPRGSAADGEGALAILTGSDATVAYDLATGEVAWTRSGMSKNPVNSAVVAGGLAYVMNSYKGRVIQAIRLGAAGEPGAEPPLAWSYVQSASYVPCPVVHDGLLYFLRDSNGVLGCLDAQTGAEVYTGRRLGDLRTVHASPVCAAGRLYVTSRDGVTVVVRCGRELEILATNALDDVVDASLAFAGDEIYLRGHRSLYCLAATE